MSSVDWFLCFSCKVGSKGAVVVAVLVVGDARWLHFTGAAPWSCTGYGWVTAHPSWLRRRNLYWGYSCKPCVKAVKHLKKGEIWECKRQTIIKPPLWSTCRIHIFIGKHWFFPQQTIHVCCCLKATILCLQTQAAKGDSDFPVYSCRTAFIHARDIWQTLGQIFCVLMVKGLHQLCQWLWC